MANDEYYKKHKRKIRRGVFFKIIFFVGISIGFALIIQEPGAFIVPLAAFILVIRSWMKKTEKLGRSFCPKCHAHYDYEEDIEWEVLSEYVEDNRHGQGASRKARMKFYCTCPECGERQVFLETVKVASANSYGTSFSDPDTEAQRLFIK